MLLSKVPDRPAKVAVYDRYGKAMVTTFATGNVVELNLLKHAKGLYYVEISISSKKTIVPVILQ